MHILIVNSEYPPIGGGAGNASANLALQLAAMGQQVTVLTAAYADLPRDETVAGVRIIRLPALRSKADRSTSIEQISFILSASLLGFNWVRRLRLDIVLAFFGAPSGVAAWLWSYFYKLPYVVSLRGGDVPGFRPYDFARQHQLLAPLLRRVWRRAAAVLANSEGLRALGTAFEPRVPIQVIPNGVDLQAFQTGQRQWQPARMLFVGRIVYQKGLDLLLNALAEFKTQDWSLNLVGDGPRVEPLRQQAAGLGLDERVHFLGWQSREELPDTYRQANLFVYPSRHEGMPNAVLEAMGSGLPVIATRIAGNEELVTEDCGLLTPPNDVASLQAALSQLLDDAHLRKQMGANARQRVEEHYSWERVAAEYLTLMQAIVEAG